MYGGISKTNPRVYNLYISENFHFPENLNLKKDINYNVFSTILMRLVAKNYFHNSSNKSQNFIAFCANIPNISGKNKLIKGTERVILSDLPTKGRHSYRCPLINLCPDQWRK